MKPHYVVLVIINVFQSLRAKLFFELNVLSGSLFLVCQNFVIFMLSLLFLLIYFMPLTNVVNPVGEIDNMNSIRGIFTSILELLIIFQLEKFVIVAFRKVLEVDVSQTGKEVFTFVVEESFFLENLPVVLGCRLLI